MEVRKIKELLVPGVATLAMAVAKPRFIAGTLDAVVVVAATGDTVIGLNDGDGQGTYTCDAGDPLQIALAGAGICEVELGDSVTVGDEVSHDSVGRGVTAGAGSTSHGICLRTGVVGDIVPILMQGRGAAIASVTATAAELNLADKSAQTEDIASAGALSVTKTTSQVAGGTGFAVTLAAPTAVNVGQLKIITLESITSSAVTLALTNCVGGTAASSASFDAAGETLVLVGIEVTPAAFKWLVLKEQGVTLS